VPSQIPNFFILPVRSVDYEIHSASERLETRVSVAQLVSDAGTKCFPKQTSLPRHSFLFYCFWFHGGWVTSPSPSINNAGAVLMALLVRRKHALARRHTVTSCGAMCRLKR